jgi:hypothetical protein
MATNWKKTMMSSIKFHGVAGGPSADHPERDGAPAQSAEPAAWEQIETGRYMPRRIRGSYRGRELG